MKTLATMYGPRSAFACCLIAFSLSAQQIPQTIKPKPAEPATAAANAAVLNEYPFSDQQDFADAQKGLIEALPGGEIKNADGSVAWDMKSYGFENTETVPPTANPSLWRVERLNDFAGLFKVTDGIYQVRGFDLANMDIIEGKTGLIIVDTLFSAETAGAALDLYYKHRPKRPVVAVIHTHSHIDHYGGVKGVVSEADVRSAKVKIFVPDGFLKDAVSENVYAGNAMGRRALYMYGVLLEKSPEGQLGSGLGKTLSQGTQTLIPPTDIISGTVVKRTIDGVEFIFQLTPGTEAPDEMNFYLPQFRALCVAENATHTLHNVLSLRGAEVRDPKLWAYYLNQTIALFGNKTDVVFAQHHWPTWGTERITTFLSDQRDMYEYINDQTLRLTNMGYTPLEIADTLRQLPPNLAAKWYTHGYYGSMSHDVRAVYQRYMGFYDGVPADLNPLPPAEEGKKFVEYMGGSQALLAKARSDFKNGQYRWVAEVTNKVVFAEPANQEAKNLEADALEQMGYQAENGTWRNIYLVGAYELRNPIPRGRGGSASPDTLRAMSIDMVFDYLGISLDGTKADGKSLVLNWNFTDTNSKYAVTLHNSALTYLNDSQNPNADATITLTKESLVRVMLGQTTFQKEVQTGNIRIDGDGSKIAELFGLLDTFNPYFNIVTPLEESQH
jgi:alkyl sulfatase BDS1-like metallo-beta-lactamase superfamily hydrolase